MKKVLAIMLVLAMLFSFAACGGETDKEGSESDFKVGVILLGDENEAYTYAHILGIQQAIENLGLNPNQVIWKYNVAEKETCRDEAIDLAELGCKYVFSNSYGHQPYMYEAAKEFPETVFVAVTGDNAISSGLDNLKNGFPRAFESRYVSGVVAGLKVKELLDNNQLSSKNFDADGNVKIGYVGAYPYAEVISGYTSFFLGIKSIVENVVMDVTYTNSWFDITKEGEAANALMSRGCVIIGQHADSTGAPSAVQAANEAGTVAYSVGYNVDMLSVAPEAALTSATNNWSVFYTYAIDAAMKGAEMDANWSKGYADNAVAISTLGSSCAEGTQEVVDSVIASIKDGSLKVFDVNNWTVNGETLTSYDTVYNFEGHEMIYDGYFHESEYRSSPCFEIVIDGITPLN